MARALRRSVTAMTSPFEEVSSFQPKLLLDPDPEWFTGLLDPTKVIRAALFHAGVEVDPTEWTMSYAYKFAPPRLGRRVEPRKVEHSDVPLGPLKDSKWGAKYLRGLEETARHARKHAGSDGVGVGKFGIDLHIFDLDRETRELLPTDFRGLTDFLNTNGGIRVYRDGIRVYDYGEPENDWLALDERRVNLPAQRISNRLVVGAVHLDSDKSRGLIEKTNREGFVESPHLPSFFEARCNLQSSMWYLRGTATREHYVNL